MPATAHVQPAAHGSTNQHGGYDARDDPDKGYHDINEKLEILQNRIKHAQTEEEADRSNTRTNGLTVRVKMNRLTVRVKMNGFWGESWSERDSQQCTLFVRFILSRAIT